ncbi:unnamed protein product [Phytophthora lilii]|uniref:Unnamed protein product n=1 Tax=Phytophthora lilii TaxID=2077276 RepID=A0A9W6YFJ1_9STRA|nr:unnamed protein product [Phytophthora lilii]
MNGFSRSVSTRDTARKSLFQRLPVDFENDAIHIVCGDFNLALDPVVDSITGERRPDSSVEPLRSWLSDSTLWMYGDYIIKRGFTQGLSPVRLHFCVRFIVASSYENSQYHSWDESDHLAHHVELTSWHHRTGPGFLETSKLAGANTRTKV